MTKAKITFCNEQKLIQEEKERLRKLRIIQVREISKQNAANLRQAFRNEKDKEIKKQLDKKETVKKHEYEENFNEIKQFVQREIDNIGSGHLSAAHYDDKIEFRQKQAAENEERAAIRGRTAFLSEKAERTQVENKENAHIIARQNAIEQEKIRAAKIAKLPKPTDDNLESVVSKKTVKLVSMHDVDAFMTTRYHMPETIVNKASLEEMDDARQSAVDEEIRLKNVEHDLKRQSNERNEKARLRGKHALEKEILSENYNDIMKELNILEQADREKRQKELLNIPREIFVPSWQREQDKKEFQLELEREFEKIYIDANMRKEQMPEPMDPKKIDEMSENGIGEDSELDLTVLNEEPQLSEDIVPIKLNAENLKQDEIHPKVSPNPDENNSTKCSPKSIEQNVLQASQEIIPESTEQHMNNANNCSKNQSSKESIVLKKIKKQREEIAQKSSGVNLSLEDSNVSDLPTNDKDCEEKKKNEENLTEKSLNESRKSKTANELEEESEPSESSDELSYTLSLNSNTPRSDVESNDKKASLNNREKKLIKGIMMSSHNVSSVRDFTLDHNRMILNSKMDSQQNFKSNAYSMDLSHASRDIMVAGPKELFNKNSRKHIFKIIFEHNHENLTINLVLLIFLKN
ncbi:hypothetical protein BpHYR1_048089 [Brachionus plicatilis]|uniref:Uncharacterized protein n=1 Tax=Brachionus plicatilis TaxID=10195 RepID=A0A3M7S996_BRAPC|nr:hypothetical protein BpHYR1_048089 [Brachionus plicatilis]